MGNKRPNLLFIMADQLRFDCLGANGNNTIITPNLDKLACEGVNVEGYYANCPVCVPSRTILFTGRYPHSHRIRENHTLASAGAEMHLFCVLKQEGYRIGYAGKNHLLRDEEFLGFDHAELERDPFSSEAESPFHHKYTMAEMERQRYAAKCRKAMAANGAFAGVSRHHFPEECTEPYIFTSGAIRFLEQQAEADRPFCLCLSILAPHAPHIAPDFICHLYDNVKMEVPPADEGELASKAKRDMVKYKAQKSGRASHADKIRFIATDYAMVTAIDRQIGRLMQALERTGLDNDTLVVFTSDHGDFLFDHGMCKMCKKDLVMADCLLHIPLIVRHKKLLRPRKTGEALVEEVDVLPTLLDLLGVALPLGVQGVSALPLLQGKARTHKTAVYGEVCAPWQRNPYSD